MKVEYNDPEVYPGTYNFRDEADDTSGTSIDFVDTFTKNLAGTAKIIASLDGHKKVLEGYNDSNYIRVWNNFASGQASGTIELWMRSTNTAGYSMIQLEESDVICIRIFWVNDKLYYDDGAWHELADVVDNTWYHIRIDFECAAGAYLGLAVDTFDIYLDGVKLGAGGYDFKVVADSLDKLRLETSTAVNYYVYWDSIGYSWDTDYAIGDNCFWRHYGGTYDFEDDDVGDDPTGWVVTEGTGTVNIIPFFNEHKKVVELDDTGAGTVEMIQTFTDGAQTTGTVEFWLRSNDVTDPLNIYIRDGTNANISLIIWSEKIQYYHTAGFHDATGGGVLNDTWYHFKIVFDITPDTYDFYLDGVLLDADIPFRVVEGTGLTDIRFISSAASANYKYYVGAVGYSWENEVADNRLLEDDWVELTTIKTYPEVRNRMDETSQITFTLNDFEGALYSKWSEHNFIGIKVLDDDDIVLFRGYLTGKSFTHDQLTCTAHGLSVRLDWIPLRKDYVEAEGLVKTIPYAGTDVPGLDGTYIVPDATPTADWTHNSVSDLADTIDNGDGTYVSAGDGNESVILEYSFPACPAGVTTIQEITVNCRCKYLGAVKTIGVTLSEDNGVGWEAYQYVTPTTVFANHTKIFTGLSLASADVTGNLLVRFRANGAYGVGEISRIVEIDVEFSSFTGSSAYALELETDDNATFTWTADQFVNDTDMGILIVDNTGNIDTLTFEATGNPVVTNGTYVSGDKEGLDTKYDALTYKFKDTTTPHNAYITIATGDAGGIADTQTLHKIEINYRIGVYRSWFLFGLNPPTKLTIKILDDDSYDNNAFIIYESSDAVGSYEWVEGTLIIEDSDTNLQKFLTKTGADYTGLVGLRLYLEGWALNLPATVSVDLLDITIYYAAVDVSPIMEQIDSNGAEYVLVDGRTWVSTELTVGDSFKIGPISTTVLTDIFTIAGVNFYLLSTLTHYIAQLYRGTYCKEILKKICLLEGLHWWEDHAHNRVIISAEVDFADSTEDLTQANYAHDWEFEDDNNYYSGVDVYGKASLEIYYRAEDLDIDSPRTKVIIEETITTLPEAQEVADAQLAEYKTKRPSIKIPLKGVYDNLRVGTTVGLTMVRPTVAETDYPIRMTERERFGGLIKTIIYCGLGHASVQERIANTINKSVLLAHQAHTDRLTAK